jgi:hypothetical protein
MDSESSEIQNAGENGGSRSSRTISLSSVDSEMSLWSECQTPAQRTVELPIELEYNEESLETPRPDGARWFSACQGQIQGTDTPKSIISQGLDLGGFFEDQVSHSENSVVSGQKRPQLRRKRSKYGGCPLAPKKTSASLHLSQVTYEKPEAFSS